MGRLLAKRFCDRLERENGPEKTDQADAWIIDATAGRFGQQKKSMAANCIAPRSTSTRTGSKTASGLLTALSQASHRASANSYPVRPMVCDQYNWNQKGCTRRPECFYAHICDMYEIACLPNCLKCQPFDVYVFLRPGVAAAIRVATIEPKMPPVRMRTGLHANDWKATKGPLALKNPLGPAQPRPHAHHPQHPNRCAFDA